MTRPTAQSGIPGVGQYLWPEQAKLTIRNVVLTSTAQVWRKKGVSDSGGDETITWAKQGKPVRARIDEKGTSLLAITSDQLGETATHIITMDPTADVTSEDRVEMAGHMWAILVSPIRTNQAMIQLYVREL